MKKSENPLLAICWKIELEEALSPQEELMCAQNSQEVATIREMIHAYEDEVSFIYASEREKEEQYVYFDARLKEEFPHSDTIYPMKIAWGGAWTRYGIGAAILIMCIVGTLYLLRDKIEKPLTAFPQALDAGMQPGDQEVAVIQADGTRLLWHQWQDGVARRQGDMEMVKDSGRLIYRLAPTQGENGADSFNIIQVPPGKQLIVRLAEQSEIALNAGSCAKVSIQRQVKTRTIELLGEAMFHVTHDITKPFYVKAGAVKVEAVGTSFSVQAYKGQEDKRVTLINGAINIDNGKVIQPVTRPMVYIANSEDIFVAPAAAQVIEEAVLRTKGMFYYKNSTLSEIIPEIMRWYRLELTDSTAYTITEHFHIDPTPRNCPVDSIVRILEGSKAVEIIITGKMMTVRKKKK